MTKTWDDLPIETLHLIISLFRGGPLDKNVQQCMLVNKKWQSVANTHLYKRVAINSVSDLSIFARKITEDKNKAAAVKILRIRVAIDEENPTQRACVRTLFWNLPNLQFYHPNSPSYVPLMDALLDSKLNSLRFIGNGPEDNFTNDYVTCALLLKSRLQSLILVGEGALFHRLYDKLDQFKNVKEIAYFGAPTNLLEKLDAIVEKCTSVQGLSVGILNTNSQTDEQTTIVSERDIPMLYTPRSTVSSLSIKDRSNTAERTMLHQNLLLYIMHKYPNLIHLKVEAKRGIEVIDISLLKRFAIYASKIDDLHIGTIATDVQWISDGFGSYWEAMRTQKPGVSRLLSINRSPSSSRAFLRIYPQMNRTTIYFPFSNYNFRDMDLFVRYGDHFDYLQISGFTKLSMIQGNPEEGIRLLENLIASSIKFCGQLRQLFVHDAYMNRTGSRMVSKTSHLTKLQFSKCSLGYGAISSVFGAINQINVLQLSECQYRDQSNQETPFININLPNTRIGSLFFSSDYSSRPRYIFVLISRFANESRNCVDTYYIYDFQRDTDCCLKVTDNTVYYNEDCVGLPHLHISCRSISSLEMRYDEHILRLPI